MEVLRKYNTAATLLFPLVDRGTLDFESTPVTFASGDTQISKDEGAFANTTNNPAHEGNGIYSLALTATEMQAARIVITIIDAATKTWEDQAILIATYGNASAQHALDLDDGTLDVNVASVDAAAGQSIADELLKRDVDNAEASAAKHSLTTLILKAVSRVRDNAGTLETYRTDGTTLHLSQTVTVDAALDPVDELGVGT